MAYEGKVPFNGHGDQVHYKSDLGTCPFPFLYELRNDDPQEFQRMQNRRERWFKKAEERIWRDNYEFYATMEFISMERGRSAAFFHLQDEDGHRYTMFMTDILDVLKRCKIEDGIAEGRWTFVKRGNNFGVRLV